MVLYTFPNYRNSQVHLFLKMFDKKKTVQLQNYRNLNSSKFVVFVVGL